MFRKAAKCTYLSDYKDVFRRQKPAAIAAAAATSGQTPTQLTIV